MERSVVSGRFHFRGPIHRIRTAKDFEDPTFLSQIVASNTEKNDETNINDINTIDIFQ